MPPVATEPERPAGSWFGPKPFTSRACVAACTVLGLGLVVERVPSLAPLRILHPLSHEAPARTHLDPAPAVGEAKITSATETRAELSLPDLAALKVAQSALGGKQQADDVALPVIDAAEPPLPLADPGGQALNGFFPRAEANRAAIAARRDARRALR
ncbi:MAG: hypothetical protein WDO69_20610 [Pseudomonadota bacterium]